MTLGELELLHELLLLTGECLNEFVTFSLLGGADCAVAATSSVHQLRLLDQIELQLLLKLLHHSLELLAAQIGQLLLLLLLVQQHVLQLF